MGITYTPNLHLGMQLDKTDYLDWNAITTNWQIIDSAIGGGTANVGRMAVNLRSPMYAGHFETLDVPPQPVMSTMFAMPNPEETEGDNNGDNTV